MLEHFSFIDLLTAGGDVQYLLNDNMANYLKVVNIIRPLISQRIYYHNSINPGNFRALESMINGNNTDRESINVITHYAHLDPSFDVVIAATEANNTITILKSKFCFYNLLLVGKPADRSYYREEVEDTMYFVRHLGRITDSLTL